MYNGPDGTLTVSEHSENGVKVRKENTRYRAQRKRNDRRRQRKVNTALGDELQRALADKEEVIQEARKVDIASSNIFDAIIGGVGLNDFLKATHASDLLFVDETGETDVNRLTSTLFSVSSIAALRNEANKDLDYLILLEQLKNVLRREDQSRKTHNMKKGAGLWLLIGGPGSGKTRFTKAISESMHSVTDTDSGKPSASLLRIGEPHTDISARSSIVTQLIAALSTNCAMGDLHGLAKILIALGSCSNGSLFNYSVLTHKLIHNLLVDRADYETDYGRNMALMDDTILSEDELTLFSLLTSLEESDCVLLLLEILSELTHNLGLIESGGRVTLDLRQIKNIINGSNDIFFDRAKRATIGELVMVARLWLTSRRDDIVVIDSLRDLLYGGGSLGKGGVSMETADRVTSIDVSAHRGNVSVIAVVNPLTPEVGDEMLALLKSSATGVLHIDGSNSLIGYGRLSNESGEIRTRDRITLDYNRPEKIADSLFSFLNTGRVIVEDMTDISWLLGMTAVSNPIDLETAAIKHTVPPIAHGQHVSNIMDHERPSRIAASKSLDPYEIMTHLSDDTSH